jgi:sugar lactone lactonase YvrE
MLTRRSRFACRLWIGSFDVAHDAASPGSLWVIHPDGSYQKADCEVTLPNGIRWSNDGKTMYLVDTKKNSIFSFDFDADKGRISNNKGLIDVNQNSGSPDGIEISIDGKILLVAQNFGGSGVYLYDTTNGKFLTKLEVPAPNVSSCHWGGENSEDLYVTSMRIAMSEQQQKDFPKSGGAPIFWTNIV